MSFWDGSSWNDLLINTQESSYRWKTKGLEKRSDYQIQITATDGNLTRVVTISRLTINNNLIYAYVIPITILSTGTLIAIGFYVARALRKRANLG